MTLVALSVGTLSRSQNARPLEGLSAREEPRVAAERAPLGPRDAAVGQRAAHLVLVPDAAVEAAREDVDLALQLRHRHRLGRRRQRAAQRQPLAPRRLGAPRAEGLPLVPQPAVGAAR